MEIKFILLEVNPRASRTVPIVSKVTGVPTCANGDKNIVGKCSFVER